MIALLGFFRRNAYNFLIAAGVCLVGYTFVLQKTNSYLSNRVTELSNRVEILSRNSALTEDLLKKNFALDTHKNDLIESIDDEVHGDMPLPPHIQSAVDGL